MTDLTPEEQDSVRAALRFLHTQMGTWEMVCRSLPYRPKTVKNALCGDDVVSARLAFRTARLAGISLARILDGAFPPAGTCLRCGHR